MSTDGTQRRISLSELTKRSEKLAERITQIDNLMQDIPLNREGYAKYFIAEQNLAIIRGAHAAFEALITSMSNKEHGANEAAPYVTQDIEDLVKMAQAQYEVLSIQLGFTIEPDAEGW